jgi:CubicO group peptidase (beta-lactamase class C family)
VRHALTHRAGVPLLPRGTATTPEELCHWEGMCAAIAALAPLWEPGARMGYHALTFGWVLGEVVRRVDGRPFGRFVREEVGRPLGLEVQLYLGLPDAEEARVATADLGPPAAPPPAPDSLAVFLVTHPEGARPGCVYGCIRARIRVRLHPPAGAGRRAVEGPRSPRKTAPVAAGIQGCPPQRAPARATRAS